MERKNKNRGIPNTEENTLLTSALIGGGIGLGVLLISAILFPIIILKTNNPNQLTLPFSAFSALVGGCTAGIISSTRCKQMPIRSGVLSSGVILLPMMTVSFILPGEYNFITALVIIVSVAASSALTALFVAKIFSSNKRNMKKVLKRR